MNNLNAQVCMYAYMYQQMSIIMLIKIIQIVINVLISRCISIDREHTQSAIRMCKLLNGGGAGHNLEQSHSAVNSLLSCVSKAGAICTGLVSSTDTSWLVSCSLGINLGLAIS